MLAEVFPVPDAIGQFAKAKYFSLETFRKTGVGVRTPVWFAKDPTSPSPAGVTTFYVYTAPDSGKVKRIRNNPRVRINPCTMRGDLRGAWVDARARICDGAEAAKGQGLLNEKYGLMKRVGDFFSRLRGRVQPVLAIELE
jgi:PPOX class probable F420-dependent enzyme